MVVVRSIVVAVSLLLPLQFSFAQEFEEPTPTPAAEISPEPTLEPTAEATAEPTVEPTIEPTVEPTIEPPAEPTVEATPTPEETPVGEERAVFYPEAVRDVPLFGPSTGWQTCDRAKEFECSGFECLSRSAYQKFYWSDLELSPGYYDFSGIELAAENAAAMGQKLDIRPIMPYAPEQDAPYYLRSMGMKGEYALYDDGYWQQYFWIADLNDDSVRGQLINLIRALGGRFDADSRIGLVDISFFGLWGEGHIGEVSSAESFGDNLAQTEFQLAYALTPQARQELIDAYIESFPNKQKVAQITDTEGLSYAVSRGAGVRLDCFGGSWMERKYPQLLADGGALEAWKTAPVVAEVCGSFEGWVNNWGPRRSQYNEERLFEIFDRAASLYHLSALNAKNGSVPAEIEPFLQEFMLKIGYRFELSEVSHQPSVQNGDSLNVKLRFNNVGVAPAYDENQVVAVRLYNEAQEVLATYVTGDTVAKQPPGEFSFEESLPLVEMASGRVTVAVAIIDKLKLDEVPTIPLALNGSAEGWYPVSSFEVVGQEIPEPTPTPESTPTPEAIPTPEVPIE